MTSRDPGPLGIYGFRNREDYSYDGLAFATALAVRERAVWDVLSSIDRHVILAGGPELKSRLLDGALDAKLPPSPGKNTSQTRTRLRPGASRCRSYGPWIPRSGRRRRTVTSPPRGRLSIPRAMTKGSDVAEEVDELVVTEVCYPLSQSIQRQERKRLPHALEPPTRGSTE